MIHIKKKKILEWLAEESWGRGKSPAFADGEFKRRIENTEGNFHLLQAFTRGLALRVVVSLSVGKESIKVLYNDYTSIFLKMLLVCKILPSP